MNRLLLTLWAVAVVALTALPGSGADPLPAEFACLVCGQRGGSDAVLNLLLFLPLGVLLAREGVGAGRAIAFGALFSLAIECAQTVIPGRDPALSDLLFNSAGTAAGWVLAASAKHWLAPRDATASHLSLAAALGVASVIGGTAVLLSPKPLRPPYHTEWAERPSTLEWYRARVLRVTLGDVSLPSGSVPDSIRVGSRLLAGQRLRVEALAGPPVPDFGPLLAIGAGQGGLLVGPDRDDLVVRYEMPAASLRLDRPQLRYPDAFRGVGSGEPLVVEVRLLGAGAEMATGAHPPRRVLFTPASGWLLLLASQVGDLRLYPAISAAWAALLLLPLGYWMRPRAESAIAAAAVAAAAVLSVVAGPLHPPGAVEWMGAGAGLALGAVLRRWAEYRAAAHPSLEGR